VLLFLCSGCAASPPFALPAGPPVPAPDGAAIWAAASQRCRAIKSYTAQLQVGGRVGGSKIKATVLAGLTSADEIRLEMPAPFGRPVFIMAGTGATATVVTRDDRVLTAPAGRVVDALVGLSLAPRALLLLLTACTGQESVVDAVRYADLLAVRTPDVRVYLRQAADEWRVVALDTGGVRADYPALANGLPSAVRVT